MPDEKLHDTWLHSDRFIPARFVRPALRFTQIEAASGAVLLGAAVVALLWANFASESYREFWEVTISLELGPLHLEETFKDLVNDGLMAIFFFVVGLEIKRELVLGELRDPKAAALPIIAALGGMLTPAAIYVAFNAGTGEAAQGWGIPVATDIAFSLGVVSLLGKRVPTGAKLFLLTLAVSDDIGGIAVIAAFYTGGLDLGWFGAAVAGLAATVVATRVRIRSLVFYVPVAFFVWFATLESGIHPTIAGVALGLLTPARPLYSAEEFDEKAREILDISPAHPEGLLGRSLVDHEALLLSQIARESVAPLNRLEYRLVEWSSFLIVPIFALANAGVIFSGVDLAETVSSPVTLGVFLGLVLGKLVGVTLFSRLAVATGLGRLPRGTDWRHVVGLAAIAGIGFTVSLFITELAFVDETITDFAKIGIFAASILAGIVGYAVLRAPRSSARPARTERADEPASV